MYGVFFITKAMAINEIHVRSGENKLEKKVQIIVKVVSSVTVVSTLSVVGINSY